MGERTMRQLLGADAEEATARHLEAKGYRIRDRNFHSRYGELDLVAEDGDTVCFVEVRMRSSAAWGDPSQTVSYAKQRKVVKAALHYLHVHGLEGRMVRFDVVSVLGQGEKAQLEHIPDAFDAGM
jgi:putative endonuclease